MADIERGQRIRERREELHLTQPAVVDLLEDAAKELPPTHELHPDKAGKAPLTLRGLQTYERGGGIVWEKAKLLAQVLQMDVQAMMSGENGSPTPDPFPPAVEPALTEILAAISAQLAEQTQVLSEVKRLLLDVQAATSNQLDAAAQMREAAALLGSLQPLSPAQEPAESQQAGD